MVCSGSSIISNIIHQSRTKPNSFLQYQIITIRQLIITGPLLRQYSNVLRVRGHLKYFDFIKEQCFFNKEINMFAGILYLDLMSLLTSDTFQQRCSDLFHDVVYVQVYFQTMVQMLQTLRGYYAGYWNFRDTSVFKISQLHLTLS